MPEETKTEADQDGDVSSLEKIHAALSFPSNSKLATFRAEYENRLRTFTIQNYFGKPHSLSPLICARLGFRNTGLNELQCSGCDEKLLVNFPNCLSAISRQKLTCLYEDQLADLHREECSFRRDAHYYIQQIKEKEMPSDAIPALFTQVWRPEEVLELLDALRPCGIIRKRWRKVIEWLQEFNIKASIDYKSWKLPSMNSEAFRDCDFAQLGETFLQKVLELIFKDAECTNDSDQSVPHEVELAALIIVLLGWTQDSSDPSSSGLHCSICLSKLNLGIMPQVTSNSNEFQHPTKRLCQRLNAPVDSHRYFCPYVRGLPRREGYQGMKFCERIILRILNEVSSRDNQDLSITPVEYRLEIRKLLKDVISPSHWKVASSTTTASKNTCASFFT